VADRYGEFVASELSDAVSSSQETSRRALTVVTTAGVLVTLMSTAIGIAAANREDAYFPESASSPLTRAIVWFIVAAILALITQLPLVVTYASVKSLRALVREHWDDDESEAGQQVADARVNMLRTQRWMNGARSWLLILAILAEVVAIAYTGVVAQRVVDSLTSPSRAESPSTTTTTRPSSTP
jgi:hypothetical protein